MAEQQGNSKEEGSERVQAAPPINTAEELVQLTGRVPKALRNRVKRAAIELDTNAQEIQRRALEEFLSRHNL